MYNHPIFTTDLHYPSDKNDVNVESHILSTIRSRRFQAINELLNHPNKKQQNQFRTNPTSKNPKNT
ncbi:hypothetical protein AAHH80_35055, partial [Burkholderia pseudomallei]